MAHLLAISVIMSMAMLSWGENITIDTQLGQITGMRRTLVNATVYDFRKIPFAKAPIGDLRFEKPQSHGSWNATLDARTYGPSCFQNLTSNIKAFLQNKNVSEDCLYLNIHVPFNVSNNNNKSVMVWIHGGRYTAGQAAFYDGAYLAATGDVIVVTISYRLNIFGFFAKGGIKGNFGLWDQIMAIQWVKDNIGSFGGNSQSITIFGGSAGGFSAGLLSIIPTNRGLFHRAILQSGTAISTYTMSTITKPSSEKVALSLNCSQTETTLLLKCLQDLNADDLLGQAPKENVNSLFALLFAPVIDGELLIDDPDNVLMDNESEGYAFYRSLDVVIGTVSGESSLFLDTIHHNNSSYYLPGSIVCKDIAPAIAQVDYKSNTQISNAICEKYGKVTNKTEQSLSVLDSFSDFAFNIPMIKSLRAHAENQNENGKHYQYIFSRSLPLIFKNYPTWFTSAAHQTEIIFEFLPFILKDNNTILAMQLQKFWTHFAKTGNMNAAGLPQWNEYDTTNEHYINFDVPITTRQHLFNDRSNFWLSDIPAILQGDATSTATSTDSTTSTAASTESTTSTAASTDSTTSTAASTDSTTSMAFRVQTEQIIQMSVYCIIVCISFILLV